MGTGNPTGRPRKNKPATGPDSWVDAQFSAQAEQQIAADLEYQDFLTGLGDGNASVTIHRFPKFGNVMEWCDNTTLDQATLDAIRENHGPGKYKLSFRGPQGMLGTKNVCISAPYNKDGNGRNAHDKSAETFLQSQLAMQQNLLMSVMSGMRGPDMGAMMAGLAAVMTALKPADSSKPVDPVQMFQTMMTMFQTLKPEKDSLAQLREVAGVIKEFSNDGGGGEGGMWGAISSIARDGIDKLAPVLGNLTGKQNPAVSPFRPDAAGRPAALLPASATGRAEVVTPPAAESPTVSAEENLRRWVSAQIGFFKDKAKAGKDPGFWVDYIFENSEEPGCQAVLYAIRQGATFDNVLAFDPEIGQNPQLTLWFKELYEGVKSGLSDDNMDSGGETRNAGDNKSNGAAGAPGQRVAGDSVVSPPVS